MAEVQFNPALGIRSISGKLGNLIFYTRNGKQYVRRTSKSSDPLQGILGPSSGHSRTISDADPVLNN